MTQAEHATHLLEFNPCVNTRPGMPGLDVYRETAYDKSPEIPDI